MTDNKAEIDAATSQRICAHMNKDHAVSVYAMLKAILNWDRNVNVTQVEMTSVSLDKYDLSYVICDGDLCRKCDVSVDFDPPLKSAKEAKSRIIDEHHRVFTPLFSWLVTDSWSFAAYGFYASIAIGAHLLENSEPYAAIVRAIALFTAITHVFEALVVCVLCKTKLKLKTVITAKWALLSFLVGIGTTLKVVDLATYSAKPKAESKKD